MGMASRIAAANAPGNQHYCRRATTRNNQSQTIMGNSCEYAAPQQARKGEKRLINTNVEHKIISVFYTTIL